MPNIDIHHLNDLAERPAGKSQLGELIRRLVYATLARHQPTIHFLSGESNGYAGWDGWVEVTYEERGRFRRHRSLWELSTDRKFEAKFKRDFKSARTKKLPHDWSKSDVVYVGLTLRSVTPQALASIRKSFNSSERANWAGVVLLAADDLVQWLEKTPYVEAWAAEEFQVGRGRFGRSLEHSFNAWAKQTTPSVSEQLVLAGRDTAQLVAAFRAESRNVATLLCDSTDEAVALVYSAVRTLSDSDAQLAIANSLVVGDASFADHLACQPLPPLGMPTVILAPPATMHKNRLLQAGYRVVVVLGRADDSPDVLRFDRASVQEFANALETSMAFTPTDAEVSARSVGSSVSIWHIRNLFTHSQQPLLPIWANGTHADAVVAAVFAGSWRDDSASDMRVVSALAGMSEERLSAELSPFASCTTPLLQLIGSSRLVVSPTAAFEFMQGYITKHHIRRLSSVIATVFEGVSAAVESRWRDERESLVPNDPRRELSDGLRDGLAETLLRIAVLGAPLVRSGALQGYSSAQGYVDHLIRQLPGLSSDPRILASLDRQLPLLMEAAPGPFIDALDALIQGAPEGLSMMLTDEPGIFGRSFHTGLLWGLEALAWSPDMLPRVTHLLAALDRLDSGGRLSNRPFRSLCEIFLPWNPGTACDPQTRLHVLQAVADREPQVIWRLLVDLMPGKRSFSSATHRPAWRNLGQRERKSVKRSEVLVAYELNVSLTLQMAGSDPIKLSELVEQFPNLAAHQKRAFEAALITAAQRDAPPESLYSLWFALHKLCRHHTNFADADWAMPQVEVARLEAISGAIPLNDPVLKHRWLFDEQFPDFGEREDYERRVIGLEARRRSALSDVLAAGGWEGVNRLLEAIKYRYIVGNVVGQLDCDDGEVLSAMDSWRRQEATDWMAFRSTSSTRAGLRGLSWTANLIEFGVKNSWSPKTIAMALVDYPDTRQTYDTVRDLGDEVSNEYWTRRFGYVRCAEEDIEAFTYATEQFIQHGRALDLIDQNWSDLPKLGHQGVLKVIDSLIERPPEVERFRSLGSIRHDLQHVFDWLRKHPEIGVEELARREYALLPLLTRSGFDHVDMSLHELLRRQPEFFVDVVCDLYKPASSERELPADGIEAAKARAHVAIELLDSWRTPPGVTDGVVDSDRLGSWVDSARELLKVRDRADIGDQTIGKVLYHLPTDETDGAFPPQALRVLLERWSSEHLERGLEIESINSRGVYSKALDEGGQQERELAKRWRQNAEAVGARWPRARALCLRIAESWSRDAEAEDLRAKRGRARRSR